MELEEHTDHFIVAMWHILLTALSHLFTVS